MWARPPAARAVAGRRSRESRRAGEACMSVELEGRYV